MIIKLVLGGGIGVSAWLEIEANAGGGELVGAGRAGREVVAALVRYGWQVGGGTATLRSNISAMCLLACIVIVDFRAMGAVRRGLGYAAGAVV